jgi:hypothetical protein
MSDRGVVCPSCHISQPIDIPSGPTCQMCLQELRRDYGYKTKETGRG